MRHAFFAALEESGAATRAMGWQAEPTLVWDGDQLVAGAPAWLRSDSFGEFVYDFALADASHRAGIPWYPKRVVALPFTPVSGSRLLVAPGRPDAAAALIAALAPAGGVAGTHVLFPDAADPIHGASGWFERRQTQFHWIHRGWPSFDAWLLDTFDSRARSEIRRERKKAREGLVIRRVVDPDPPLLSTIVDAWVAHVGTFGPYGRASMAIAWPAVAAALRGHVTAMTAWDGSTLVAATLDIAGDRRWYGRCWAPIVPRRFLHFELCLYAQVEAAIDAGIDAFEPGHGGEHKGARGFETVITTSRHRLAHAGLHDAIARWALAEAAAVDASSGR